MNPLDIDPRRSASPTVGRCDDPAVLRTMLARLLERLSRFSLDPGITAEQREQLRQMLFMISLLGISPRTDPFLRPQTGPSSTARAPEPLVPATPAGSPRSAHRALAPSAVATSSAVRSRPNATAARPAFWPPHADAAILPLPLTPLAAFAADLARFPGAHLQARFDHQRLHRTSTMALDLAGGPADHEQGAGLLAAAAALFAEGAGRGLHEMRAEAHTASLRILDEPGDVDHAHIGRTRLVVVLFAPGTLCDTGRLRGLSSNHRGQLLALLDPLHRTLHDGERIRVWDHPSASRPPTGDQPTRHADLRRRHALAALRHVTPISVPGNPFNPIVKRLGLGAIVAERVGGLLRLATEDPDETLFVWRCTETPLGPGR